VIEVILLLHPLHRPLRIFVRRGGPREPLLLHPPVPEDVDEDAGGFQICTLRVVIIPVPLSPYLSLASFIFVLLPCPRLERIRSSCFPLVKPLLQGLSLPCGMPCVFCTTIRHRTWLIFSRRLFHRPHNSSGCTSDITVICTATVLVPGGHETSFSASSPLLCRFVHEITSCPLLQRGFGLHAPRQLAFFDPRHSVRDAKPPCH